MTAKSTKSISVIIPIYNEATIIKSAIADCLQALNNDFEDYELIIVNDGSKDNTQQILDENFVNTPQIRLLSNYINLNQGISVQRAMTQTTKEYTVHNGVDLPLRPSEIKKHLETMGDVDVLVLERKRYSGATPWRKLTSNVNTLLRTILFPLLTKGISDMNFTQIYRTEIISQILPLAKSPAFTAPEIIMRAKLLNLKIKTVDSEFQARQVGGGSLGKLHDILWTIYDMCRFRYLVWIGINKHGIVK
jgi:dolichol-phosphate mannosyltransferase